MHTTPTPSPTDAPEDVIAVLRRQHDQVRGLLRDIREGTADRQESFDELVRLLAMHETAEEIVVHPMVAKLGSSGEAVARARTDEEDSAKKVLAQLEHLRVGSPEFAAEFAAFAAAVERHAEAEEAETFRILVSHCDLDELRSMGERFLLAERVAPTHAHASAPEGPIGNMVVGPFMAVADRVRDALSGRKR